MSSRHFPAAIALGCITAFSLSLAACSGSDSQPAEKQPTAASTPQASTPPAEVADATEPPAAGIADDGEGTDDADLAYAVPGYQPGEIPPIPAIELPDLGLLAGSQDKFTINTTKSIKSVPGVKVSPARCDGEGLVSGGMVLNGDGSGTASVGGKTITNNGDGSGTVSSSDTTITNNGDGSGTYSGPDITMTNNGDGSGTYSSKDLTVSVNGDGSGTFSSGEETVSNNGDGSGTFSDEDVTTSNNGDGTGTYSDNDLTITIGSDGTATVVGPDGTKEFPDRELPKVAPIGSFPPIDALKPIKSCGTTITFEDGVLFDFGKYDIRPEAEETLSKVAGVLKDADVPKAGVYGHTDSISSAQFNQTLSENRASAVVDVLEGDGVTTDLEAEGFGKTKPIAPNTNEDGSDDPAGRQLNRRVEIFIPAF
ncbi:OmpA family protein [Galactobacter sp.]|uniref:OmpA family protein n=1 Tax=Galactobacter sp. TaxID=2676125 RepID=UPI0025C68BC3|nr:OmpA family protein [Galactobacter sp.]